MRLRGLTALHSVCCNILTLSEHIADLGLALVERRGGLVADLAPHADPVDEARRGFEALLTAAPDLRARVRSPVSTGSPLA